MQELIAKLTSELGIDAKQAEGGLSVVMKFVKDQLGGEAFEKVKEAVPEAEALADAAPEEKDGGQETGGLMDIVGSVAGALGGGKLEGMASLAVSFEKLGLDASMVAQFLPKVMEFFETKGKSSGHSGGSGIDLASLIGKVLGGGK